MGAPALLLVFIVCAVRPRGRASWRAALAAPQNALAEEGAAAEAVPLHRRVAAAVRQDLGGVLSKWMLLISLFHSAICCAIFQIFNCTVKYEPFDRKFLVSDYSIRCSGPGYEAHKARDCLRGDLRHVSAVPVPRAVAAAPLAAGEEQHGTRATSMTARWRFCE